jgi:hypothetical protein
MSPFSCRIQDTMLHLVLLVCELCSYRQLNSLLGVGCTQSCHILSTLPCSAVLLTSLFCLLVISLDIFLDTLLFKQYTVFLSYLDTQNYMQFFTCTMARVKCWGNATFREVAWLFMQLKPAYLQAFFFFFLTTASHVGPVLKLEFSVVHLFRFFF